MIKNEGYSALFFKPFLGVKDINEQVLLRRGIQSFFLIFYAYVGIKFYFYVSWAMGYSDHYVAKLPSVGAFLPIGALVGLKRLIFTGQYETVHPASLTIFIMALGLSFLLRKSFCGYLCPMGALANIFESLGKKLNIQKTPPRWLSILLSLPKYFLLGFFAYLIFTMNLLAIERFVQTTYWRVADSRMLFFFLHASSIIFVIVGVVILGNMIIPGFWCRGFCPYGALLGLFSFFSPLAVQRDEAKCISCKKCSQACASRILVHKSQRIKSPECVGCGECVTSCPQKDCLELKLGYTKKSAKVPVGMVGGATIFIVVLVWVWALNTGHWYGPVNHDQIRSDHEQVLNMAHP